MVRVTVTVAEAVPWHCNCDANCCGCLA